MRFTNRGYSSPYVSQTAHVCVSTLSKHNLVEYGADMKGLNVVPAIIDEDGKVVYLGDTPSLLRNVISYRRQLTQRLKK